MKEFYIKYIFSNKYSNQNYENIVKYYQSLYFNKSKYFNCLNDLIIFKKWLQKITKCKDLYEAFYKIFDDKQYICLYCGKLTSFDKNERKYKQYCDKKCFLQYNKLKLKNDIRKNKYKLRIKKFLIQNNFKVEDIQKYNQLFLYLPDYDLYIQSFQEIYLELSISYCYKNKILLFWSYEVLHSFQLVKHHILTILNPFLIKNQINISKEDFFIKKLTDKKIVNSFLHSNTLQQFNNNYNFAYALYINNKDLISLITFKNTKQNYWKIQNFMTKKDFYVINGYKVILKEFIKKEKVKNIRIETEIRLMDYLIIEREFLNFKKEKRIKGKERYFDLHKFRFGKPQYLNEFKEGRIKFIDSGYLVYKF